MKIVCAIFYLFFRFLQALLPKCAFCLKFVCVNKKDKTRRCVWW